jgi:tetraacyldisaccharide 4'-kinase
MKLKKPEFWDYKKPNIISYILLPLTFILKLSNLMLDNYRPSKDTRIMTICLGNIYVGGTGKTPTTIKLYNLIKKLNYRVVTAKKFYKQEKDEQLLLSKETDVIIAKKRNEILNHAIKRKREVIIFDDGLQDKTINYDIKFVCFNALEWIGNGKLLPSGPLREEVNSLRKYDGIFIKGDDYIKSKKISRIIKKIKPNIKIFFTNYKINNLKNFDVNEKFLLFSGIGSPNNLKDFLKKKKFRIVSDMIYPDHYKYKDSDLINILFKAKQLKLKIITTQKDYVKIPRKFRNKIKFLKVELYITNENDLKNFLKKKINEKS